MQSGAAILYPSVTRSSNCFALCIVWLLVNQWILRLMFECRGPLRLIVVFQPRPYANLPHSQVVEYCPRVFEAESVSDGSQSASLLLQPSVWQIDLFLEGRIKNKISTDWHDDYAKYYVKGQCFMLFAERQSFSRQNATCPSSFCAMADKKWIERYMLT